MRRLRGVLLATSALVAAGLPAAAQNATWLANPGSSNFSVGTNWSTGNVPTGTAFFGTSSQTAISLGGNVFLDSWTFNTGAPTYTFTTGAQSLEFAGAGIVNGGSTVTINNSADANTQFSSSATAGNAVVEQRTSDGRHRDEVA